MAPVKVKSAKPGATTAEDKLANSKAKSVKKPKKAKSENEAKDGAAKETKETKTETMTTEKPKKKDGESKVKVKEAAQDDEEEDAKEEPAKDPDDIMKAFSKIEDDYHDDTDVELEALLKARAAKRKNKRAKPTAPSASALGLIREQFDDQFEQARKHVCSYRRRKWTIIFIMASAAAIAIICVFSLIHLGENDLGKNLWPPTGQSWFACMRLYVSCIAVTVLGLAGFFILNFEVTSLITGMIYMFGLICGVYVCSSTSSRAMFSWREEDFNDVVNHSVRYAADKGNGSLPAYVIWYQRKKKCCGWGPFYWSSWSEVLNTTDLPDSCCRNEYKGCGKNLIPKHPSGYLAKLAYDDLVALKAQLTPPIYDHYQRLGEYVMSTILHIPLTDPRTVQDVPPVDWLRHMDEKFALTYYGTVVPGEPPPPPLGPGGLRAEIPVKIFPRGDPKNTTLPKEESLVYFSRGLEEFTRIKTFVHPKPCETATSFPRSRGVHSRRDRNMMNYVVRIMIWVFGYGVGLGLTCILMAGVFWYYFSRTKALELAEAELPKDFQDLDIEAVNFADEDKGDEDEATRLKLEEIQRKREERQIAHHKQKELEEKAHLAQTIERNEREEKQKLKKRRSKKGKNVPEGDESYSTSSSSSSSPAEGKSGAVTQTKSVRFNKGEMDGKGGKKRKKKAVGSKDGKKDGKGSKASGEKPERGAKKTEKGQKKSEKIDTKKSAKADDETKKSAKAEKKSTKSVKPEDEAKKSAKSVKPEDEAKKSAKSVKPEDEAKKATTSAKPEDGSKKSVKSAKPEDETKKSGKPEEEKAESKSLEAKDQDSEKIVDSAEPQKKKSHRRNKVAPAPVKDSGAKPPP